MEGIYAMSDEFEESWFEADFETMKWKEIKNSSRKNIIKICSIHK